MRLIDADALALHLEGVASCYRKDNENSFAALVVEETVLLDVMDFPTIDAVPVVRCKDCWNATKMGGFMGEVLYCPIWERNTEDEYFCCHGERKGGDNK